MKERTKLHSEKKKLQQSGESKGRCAEQNERTDQAGGGYGVKNSETPRRNEFATAKSKSINMKTRFYIRSFSHY